MPSFVKVVMFIQKPDSVIGSVVVLLAGLRTAVVGGAGVADWLCAWTSLGILLCHHVPESQERGTLQTTIGSFGPLGALYAVGSPVQTVLWAALMAYAMYLVFMASDHCFILFQEAFLPAVAQNLPPGPPQDTVQDATAAEISPENPTASHSPELQATPSLADVQDATVSTLERQKILLSKGMSEIGAATALVGSQLSWSDCAMAEEIELTRLERPAPSCSNSYSEMSPVQRLLRHDLPKRTQSGRRPSGRPVTHLGQRILPATRRQGRKQRVEILHVSNDRVQHMVLKKFLQAHNFDVKHANGAERLLDLLQCRNAHYGVESFPDIVLMESEMHGMCSVEALKVIRMLYPQAPMPVIVVGDGDMPEHEVCKALQAGAVDYMANPLTRQALLARIGVQLNLQKFWQSKVEAAQNEHLLQKILPSSVIQRLKFGKSCISDELDQVSVLFSDIKGFTSLAASIDTVELIDILDTLFSSFDSLTDKYGVYKIETIGDAYMVVSGHDDESKADQMQRLMGMAQDMLKEVQAQNLPNDGILQIRIGIHTGPAYAGVVGRKCPRYCLFGETVTVANKMESNGYPQTIHVSDRAKACYEATGGTQDFESLGVSNPTGKERMETWVVKQGNWQGAVNSRAENLMAMSDCSVSSRDSMFDDGCNSPFSPLSLEDNYFIDEPRSLWPYTGTQDL